MVFPSPKQPPNMPPHTTGLLKRSKRPIMPAQPVDVTSRISFEFRDDCLFVTSSFIDWDPVDMSEHRKQAVEIAIARKLLKEYDVMSDKLTIHYQPDGCFVRFEDDEEFIMAKLRSGLN